MPSSYDVVSLSWIKRIPETFLSNEMKIFFQTISFWKYSFEQISVTKIVEHIRDDMFNLNTHPQTNQRSAFSISITFTLTSSTFLPFIHFPIFKIVGCSCRIVSWNNKIQREFYSVSRHFQSYTDSFDSITLTLTLSHIFYCPWLNRSQTQTRT